MESNVAKRRQTINPGIALYLKPPALEAPDTDPPIHRVRRKSDSTHPDSLLKDLTPSLESQRC